MYNVIVIQIIAGTHMATANPDEFTKTTPHPALSQGNPLETRRMGSWTKVRGQRSAMRPNQTEEVLNCIH